jgi:hypothetical protein
MAINRPRITYENRPSLAHESRYLDKGIADILRNDPNFLFYYIVTYVGDANGLNNFKLKVFGLSDDGNSLVFIVELSYGDGSILAALARQRESEILISQAQDGIYTYEYSEHYL